MDWFLYDNGPRLEKVNDVIIYSCPNCPFQIKPFTPGVHVIHT